MYYGIAVNSTYGIPQSNSFPLELFGSVEGGLILLGGGSNVKLASHPSAIPSPIFLTMTFRYFRLVPLGSSASCTQVGEPRRYSIVRFGLKNGTLLPLIPVFYSLVYLI